MTLSLEVSKKYPKVGNLSVRAVLSSWMILEARYPVSGCECWPTSRLTSIWSVQCITHLTYDLMEGCALTKLVSPRVSCFWASVSMNR